MGGLGLARQPQLACQWVRPPPPNSANEPTQSYCSWSMLKGFWLSPEGKTPFPQRTVDHTSRRVGLRTDIEEGVAPAGRICSAPSVKLSKLGEHRWKRGGKWP